MGEIILGFPGPWAKDYREESDHFTTKIGGLPDWPIRDLDVGLDVLNCGLCGERLCLVAQVYAPVSMPKLNIEERVIYIFGCRMSQCGSNPRSWRAIRVQKCHDEKQICRADKEVMTLEEDLSPVSKNNGVHLEDLLSFGENDDDSNNDIDLEELSQAFSKAGAQVSQPMKPNGSSHSTKSKKAKNALVLKSKSVYADTSKPVVPCFYIYLQKAQFPSDINVACSSYSSLSSEGTVSSPKDNDDEEKWEGENYEYDRALGADRTYLKFKKHLDSFPDQCLRYSYGGKPLLATKDVVEPDTCRLCGSSQQFEMQLMSPLLYFLHEADGGPSTCIPDEWSWMTIILNTCSSTSLRHYEGKKRIIFSEISNMMGCNEVIGDDGIATESGVERAIVSKYSDGEAEDETSDMAVDDGEGFQLEVVRPLSRAMTSIYMTRIIIGLRVESGNSGKSTLEDIDND